MKIQPAAMAADQIEQYYEHDPELMTLIDEVLDLLERDDPDDEGHERLRRTYLRPAGAFCVRLYPKRRTSPYYLFWQPELAQTVAFVRFAGPGKAEI